MHPEAGMHPFLLQKRRENIMKYQVQENCLTIFLPREVDHHHAEEIRKNADMVIEKITSNM